MQFSPSMWDTLHLCHTSRTLKVQFALARNKTETLSDFSFRSWLCNSFLLLKAKLVNDLATLWITGVGIRKKLAIKKHGHFSCVAIFAMQLYLKFANVVNCRKSCEFSLFMQTVFDQSNARRMFISWWFLKTWAVENSKRCSAAHAMVL